MSLYFDLAWTSLFLAAWCVWTLLCVCNLLCLLSKGRLCPFRKHVDAVMEYAWGPLNRLVLAVLRKRHARRLDKLRQFGVVEPNAVLLGAATPITTRDIHILVEDLTSAFAHYPEANAADMVEDLWFRARQRPPIKVPPGDPMRYLTSIEPKSGEECLYAIKLGVTRPEYPERADVAATEKFYAGLDAWRLDRARRRKDFTFTTAWPNYQLHVACDRQTGCVMHVHAKGEARKWEFPFVPEEWLLTYYRESDIRKLPSFKGAIESPSDMRAPEVDGGAINIYLPKTP